MYHDGLGRFMTRDPLPQEGEPDLLYDNNEFGRWLDMMQNLYGYCNSRPLDLVDPLGEESANPEDLYQGRTRECTTLYVDPVNKMCPPGSTAKPFTTRKNEVPINSGTHCIKDCDRLANCPMSIGICQLTETTLTIRNRVTRSWRCACR